MTDKSKAQTEKRDFELAKHDSLLKAVKGFLAPAEGRTLFRLAVEACTMGPCLEVGSYCGKSAVYLGLACKRNGSVLFSVDHHLGSQEHQPGQLYFDPDLYDSKNNRIDTLPRFRDTLRQARLQDTVVPLVTRSRTAARRWATPLSLVFIDGGHAYHDVHTDYQCWCPHLLPGGYLIFHDIFEDPDQGGQAPYRVYRLALESGNFRRIARKYSLGILQKLPC